MAVALDKIIEIKELYRDGESKSYIAKYLGLDYKTVTKYVNKVDFNETLEDYVKKT